MDTFKVMEISAAGMAFQRTRVEVAALNLANVGTTRPGGATPYQPLTVVSTPQHIGFDALWLSLKKSNVTVPTASVIPTGAAPKLVREPGHPHADANGMVAYPAVDHLGEMMAVMNSTRIYEANLAALQTTRTMATRALEIGGNS